MTDRPQDASIPVSLNDVQARVDHALKEGDRLGNRYLLQRRIGAGGMSVVWRAWDEALQRPVAVKVMHMPLVTGLGGREMLRREARAAARIEHPNAMGVYDVGETITSGGRLTAYVVMRLLDGHSLADILDDGPLIWQDAVDIVCRVADVLAAAHGHGIVHRDVTPENVLLTDEGAKLLDFGIAAHVGERDNEVTSPVFGTPPYVAPERLHGAEAEGATDVYALGVLMFQMLTGYMPYPETTWEELERVTRRGRPPKPTGVPGLPRRIRRLCQRCLEPNPSDRPTAAELVSVLARVLSQEDRVFQRAGQRLMWVAVACVVIGATAVILTGPDHSTPTAQQTSQPASPTPSPSTAEVAIPAPHTYSPAQTTPPAASVSASPSASPVSVAEAKAAVLAILDQGEAEETIRTDVAADFRNQVNSLASDPASDQGEREQRIQDLRANIIERIDQDGITEEVAAGLDAAVVVLGEAIEWQYTSGSSQPAT